MKESKLIQMLNKVDNLGRLIDEVVKEVVKTQNMTIGTLEVLKRMPGYKKALDKLTKENTKEDKEKP
tara:strand:+ start:295 stop:495 length:201 start_codon:yes stop_codon:yes gene_type:complete